MGISKLGRLAPALFALFVLTSGCGGDDEPSKPIGTVMPDFTLQDVNPNSLTTGQPISPRAYLSRVSAWYFGHAT